MTETPIFDEVQKNHIEQVPLPPLKTHEQFMHEHAEDVWLERIELILAGEIEPPKAPVKPIRKSTPRDRHASQGHKTRKPPVKKATTPKPKVVPDAKAD